MEPLKIEIEALESVLLTPLASFVTDRERAEKGEEWAENMARKRMFSSAIKAVDRARGERTLYFATVQFGPRWVQNFGPYATEKKALAALEEINGWLGNLVVGNGITTSIHPAGWESMKERTSAKSESTGWRAEVELDVRAFKNGWDGKAATRHKYLEPAA